MQGFAQLFKLKVLKLLYLNDYPEFDTTTVKFHVYCKICMSMIIFRLVGWLVVFNVPSTARSLRDGTPIYCPLRKT